VRTTNGTFNGNDPCWTGNGVDFNGVSDFFSVPGLDDVYAYNNTFSVAGWFKTSQTTGSQTIVGSWLQYGSGYTEGFGWQVLVENSTVVARFGAAAYSDITGTKNVNDGNWHHFVLVYPTLNSDEFLYVDGQQEGTPGRYNIARYGVKFRIGDGSYSSGNPPLKGGPFCGKIDDVMIFNRALTADEVYQLYLAGR